MNQGAFSRDLTKPSQAKNQYPSYSPALRGGGGGGGCKLLVHKCVIRFSFSSLLALPFLIQGVRIWNFEEKKQFNKTTIKNLPTLLVFYHFL